MSNTNQSVPENKLSTQVEDPSKPDAPQHQHGLFEEAKNKFSAFSAAPGPALVNNINVPQEGTKEERLARAKELNKDN